jgi:hypothetical protein
LRTSGKPSLGSEKGALSVGIDFAEQLKVPWNGSEFTTFSQSELPSTILLTVLSKIVCDIVMSVMSIWALRFSDKIANTRICHPGPLLRKRLQP